MQKFLILVYSLIIIATVVLMTILIKYTKEKLLNKHFLRNQILIDLGFINTVFIVEICFFMIARSIIGPIQNVLIVEAIMITQQCFYDLVLSCIVSLQITQVLSVFWSAKLGEIRDNLIIIVHRIFVLFFGLILATMACYHKNGMCRPIPLYYYFLQDDLEPSNNGHDETPINKPFVTWLFIGIISSCQAAIEIKRYLIKKEDLKMEQMAAFARCQFHQHFTRVFLVRKCYFCQNPFAKAKM